MITIPSHCPKGWYYKEGGGEGRDRQEYSAYRLYEAQFSATFDVNL